ncbi:hypothetical protein AB0K14_18280 [Actinosynnema sp. NPDC050801]|uniref:hypothetical protein n=1 Tax=unclassified Actinosynnema TaxID=2637065 RepID=UPI0033F03475
MAQHPELRDHVDRAHCAIATWALPLITDLGSTDPPADLALLLAVVDGLLTNRPADPGPRFDPTTAVRAVLRGILAG